MSTIITILSCALIGQFTVAGQPAVTAAEPMQAASAEDERPSADPFPRSAQATNSPADQAVPAELPQALVPAKAVESPGDRTSTMPDSSTPLRKHPPEMIAEAMTLPSGSAIAGQPLALVQALSASADRPGQLAIVHVYWQTVEAVVKYRYCLDQVDQLDRLQPRREEDISLQAARSAAMAMLREAELAASSSQHELAALVQLPPDAPLPLPTDRPHVGAYRSNYQELFAQRTGTDRARLIDRTLPIRRMAIDERAVAVQAAQDALAAAIDLCQARQGSLQSVISSSDRLSRQQRELIESVCRYNHDIAEYAMTVAGPGVTPQALVGLMIKTTSEAGQPPSAEEGGVQPTGLTQPVPTPANRSENSQSPPSPLRTTPGGSVIPTAPPATRWGPANTPLRRAQDEPLKNKPTLAPPRDGTTPGQKSESTPPAPQNEEGEKIRYSVGDPFTRRVQTVQKTITELAEATVSSSSLNKSEEEGTDSSADSAALAADAVETATALYPALVEAKPAVRAKQLTLALHWDRSLPEGIGKPMTLEECLTRQAGADRRATVEAFWIVRQRAAEYQVLAQEIEFLDSLAPVVLGRRAQPEGAAQMLYLRAARRSAMADLQEAQAALLEAQFDLSLRTQSAVDSIWPLPTTPPHSGQYLLNLEAQPRSLVQSWPTRYLAATIPAYGSSIQEHAAAVVAADVARVKVWEKYVSGNLPVEQALEAVARQTQLTYAFLQTLTDYNRAIAQYALMVLPADASPAKITSALVVQR